MSKHVQHSQDGQPTSESPTCVEQQNLLLEQRFRALIENSTDIIALFDTNGIVLYISPSIERWLGYKPEEITGHNTLEFIHPDDHEKIGTVLGGILQELGKSLSTEYRVQHKDGSWRWMEGMITNLLHDPSVQAIVGNIRDITDRHHAEEERECLLKQLEIEHARLTEVLRQMPAGVVIAEAPSGKIIRGNRQVEEILRHSILPTSNIEEYVNWTGFHLDGRAVRAEEWPLVRAITNGEVVTGEEYEYLRGDGTHTFIRINAAPIRGQDGHILAGVATFYDIAEYKELEQRKDDFISIASHELRTPITTLKGFTQILKRMFQKQGLQEPIQYLTKMETQINNLTNLVADLLDISKISSGQLEFTQEAFDFDEFVRDGVENIQQTSPTHTILVTGMLQKEVVGDKDRLGQVLSNLLTNAIKYSPDADTVDVEVSSDVDNVIVRIRDYGVGIPQEHQEKIFERFYRVYNTAFTGLGIGLYISSGIVKRHDGKMWVESGEGQGSTFSFSVPLQRVPQA